MHADGKDAFIVEPGFTFVYLGNVSSVSPFVTPPCFCRILLNVIVVPVSVGELGAGGTTLRHDYWSVRFELPREAASLLLTWNTTRANTVSRR